VPVERGCPICKSNLRVEWKRPLPVLPEENAEDEEHGTSQILTMGEVNPS
jgi:hypothetical protein